MKKLFLIMITFIIFLSFMSSMSSAMTYYIRPDGGNAIQCTGTIDAPYPGSGLNQPCAWSHPFWALIDNGDETASWRITGGDTLVIYQGSYMIGYGAPNSFWCSQDWTYGCYFPPLPSGPDPLNPTRILGAGWDTGCTIPPELWGTERLSYILNLEGTSNAVIDCLELTDHSGCVEYHENTSVRCERDNYPYGEWADRGIFASDSSSVTLRHLNIHGLSASGIHAGRLSNWTVEDVRIAGNGMVGWDGDIWDEAGDSNSGTLTFRRWTVEWNGCAETYPGDLPDHCWAQSAGGYGDGVGVGRTGGNWIIEDSVIRYNTSDGLDLLYVSVDHPDSTIEVRRTSAYGNAGNQIKLGGSSTLINNLIVGNCGYFYQKSFAQEMGGIDSGDICRAGGAAISLNPGLGDSASVVNSTIASQGWALVECGCITNDFPDQIPCNGTETVTLQNNVFRGYQVFVILDRQRLSDFVGDGDPSGLTTGMVDYNIIYNAEILSPTGPNDMFLDPLLINDNLDNFNGHLQTGSPAIDSGLAVGSIGGLVPNHDLEGQLRPHGSGVDRGAYEYGGTIVVPSPDIKANTSDGPLTIDSGITLSVTAALTPGSFDSTNADWWIAADTSFGWYYYIYPDGWYHALNLSDFQPAHQGALFTLSPVEVLNITGLPAGTYIFYFGVDTNMNGQLDFDQLYYDGVIVTLTQ